MLGVRPLARRTQVSLILEIRCNVPNSRVHLNVEILLNMKRGFYENWKYTHRSRLLDPPRQTDGHAGLVE